MVDTGYKVSEILSKKGKPPFLINLRFAKPLDETFIKYIAGKVDLIVTMEEGAVLGGIGESISAVLSKEKNNCKVVHIGIPDDFIVHGANEELFKIIGLDEDAIAEKINFLLVGKKI